MTDLPVLPGSWLPEDQACQHRPTCPDARAADRFGARAVKSHPQQGWSLLCNGVVLFDDGGALLPEGGAVPPTRTCGCVIGRAA